LEATTSYLLYIRADGVMMDGKQGSAIPLK
jgi:hypothetical protein